MTILWIMTLLAFLTGVSSLMHGGEKSVGGAILAFTIAAVCGGAYFGITP